MTRIFLIIGFSAIFYVGVQATRFYDQTISRLGVLKHAYPVVLYLGKQRPPQIEFHKKKPPHWVSLSEISQAARDAILISEDASFYQHPGFDWDQMKEAFLMDLDRKAFSHGGSTITQQLAKNLFLERDKTLSRKIKELVVAIELEKNYPKHQIFEIYLNIAEWGEGIFGILPASLFYFHKIPSALTPKEGAFLAMLLPSPKRYSQSYRSGALSPYATKTIRTILSKLVQANHLTASEAKSALASPLEFERFTNSSVPSTEDLDEASQQP